MKTFCLILLLFSLPANSAVQVVGKVYPITEEDPYHEISVRAQRVDIDKFKNKILKRNTYIEGMRTPPLPRVGRNHIRQITPTAVAPADISDKDGNILYPKGYEFNPLKYRKMRGRIVIIDQTDIGRIEIEGNDTVIINKGDIKESSTLIQRPTYILDKFTASTLKDLRYSPTIIKQVGEQLEYMEIELRDIYDD